MCRLNTAGDLLRETNKSLTEIAHACGFKNVSFFIREFKKAYSVTPNKSRKNYRQEINNKILCKIIDKTVEIVYNITIIP